MLAAAQVKCISKQCCGGNHGCPRAEKQRLCFWQRRVSHQPTTRWLCGCALEYAVDSAVLPPSRPRACSLFHGPPGPVARVAGGSARSGTEKTSLAGMVFGGCRKSQCARGRGTDYGQWAGQPAVRRAPANLLRSLALSPIDPALTACHAGR